MKSKIPVLLWLVAAVGLGVVAWQVDETPTVPAVAERIELTLSSPRQAQVAQLTVGVGEAVQANQIVARLSAPGLDDEVRVAQAELARLRAVVQAAADDARADHQSQAHRLAAQADRAALDAAEAKASQQRDRARLAGLRTRRAQQAEWVAQGLVTRRELDQIDAEIVTLRQRIAASRTAVRQAKANAEAGRGRTAPVLPVSIAPQEHAVLAQQERLKALERAQAALVLRAPIAGHVSQIHLRAGETATAGAPVLALVQTQVDTVVAYVDEAWSHQVGVGDQAFLTDRPGTMLDGKVVSIAPDVRELPRRLWLVHTQPRFGRPVRVQLAAGGPTVAPGQALDVWFRRRAP